MAHEIMASDGLVLAGESAWHGLGTVVEQAPSIAGALQIAGLDWDVDAWPLAATDGEKKVAVGTHVLNVRRDTGAGLGVVGKNYVPLQNRELAGFAEQLAGEGAKVESAGSIRGGKRVWMLIRTDEIVEVGRNGEDQVVPYIMLANGHDGTLSFTVMPTSIRVVCSNTLHFALRSSADDAKAGRALRVRHTSGMKWRVDDARAVLEAHGIIIKSWRAQVGQLAQRHLTGREISAYFENVYAAGFTKPTTSRGESRRENVLSDWRAKIDDPKNSLDGIRGTAWGALSVVTDFVDHDLGSPDQTKDDRLYRGWFGSGVKVKAGAWDEALATL